MHRCLLEALRSLGFITGLWSALLSLPMLAAAEQTPQNYMKFAVGIARSDIDVWGRESDTAVSLAYGTTLQPNFDLELGYINFGKANYRGATDTLSAKSQAVFAAVVGHYPVQPAFSVYGKLGAAYHWNKWSGTVAGVRYNDDDNRLAPMIGVGLSWKFMPDWSADIDYSYFNNAAKSGSRSANLDLLTVGVKYLF